MYTFLRVNNSFTQFDHILMTTPETTELIWLMLRRVSQETDVTWVYPVWQSEVFQFKT